MEKQIIDRILEHFDSIEAFLLKFRVKNGNKTSTYSYKYIFLKNLNLTVAEREYLALLTKYKSLLKDVKRDCLNIIEAYDLDR